MERGCVKRSRRGVIVRNIVLIVLLAVLCIGGTELIVCRFEDPALYAEIVAPVESAARAVGGFVRDVSLSAARGVRSAAVSVVTWAENLFPPPADDGAQLAGDPALQTDYVPADPSVTELVVEEGQEYLLGGVRRLVYFNQGDEEWASEPFGVDPIGPYGCGPTALAMLVSSMTDTYVDPAEMAAWAAAMGYAAPHSGSYLSIVAGTAEHYGLDCASFPELDVDALCQELATGGTFVALMGPGHFTQGGHFILIHGVTLTGEVLVADPNSRENSLMTWDPQLLIDELSASRYEGAPLWLFPGYTSL